MTISPDFHQRFAYDNSIKVANLNLEDVNWLISNGLEYLICCTFGNLKSRKLAGKLWREGFSSLYLNGGITDICSYYDSYKFAEIVDSINIISHFVLVLSEIESQIGINLKVINKLMTCELYNRDEEAYFAITGKVISFTN